MKKIFKKIKLFALSALILLASFVGVQSCAGVNVLSPKVATASAESVTPAQVSDLTNTTWLLNESPTYLQSEESFEIFGEINYTINSTPSILSISYVDIYINRIWFREINGGENAITTYFNNEWSYYNDNSEVATPITGDIFLTVTGGEDTTNATLIAWLEDNATLINSEPTIDDLTGTALKFNDTINYTLGGDDSVYYEITFAFANGNFDFENRETASNILIEEYDGQLTITYIYSGDSTEEYIVYTSDDGWFDGFNQYIYIPYGTDATNTDLINFITANATIYTNDEISFFSDVAYNYGRLDGYIDGYYAGVEVGYNGGYAQGFTDGQMIADSIGQSMWDYMFIFIQNLFNALTALLSVELVRGVNLGLVTIGIPMIIWAIGAIIRLVLFFFGGSQ